MVNTSSNHDNQLHSVAARRVRGAFVVFARFDVQQLRNHHGTKDTTNECRDRNYARCNSAMSNFFIFIIACIARCDFPALSPPLMISRNAFGIICHDRPN